MRTFKAILISSVFLIAIVASFFCAFHAIYRSIVDTYDISHIYKVSSYSSSGSKIGEWTTHYVHSMNSAIQDQRDFSFRDLGGHIVDIHGGTTVIETIK